MENIWKARKALSPAVYKIAPDKINEDIVVPRSEIPKMTEFHRKTPEGPGTVNSLPSAMQGDGNIHVNVMLDKKDKAALEKGKKGR